MSGTVKTVLIVGGVAAGAFLLFRALSPTRAIAPRPTSSGGNWLNALTTILPAITTAIGGSGGVGIPTSGAPSVGYEPGESFDDFYTGMFGPGSLDVLSS